MQRVGVSTLVVACLWIVGAGLVGRTCRSELIYFRKGGEAQLAGHDRGQSRRPGFARRQGRAGSRRDPKDRAGILAAD